MENKHLEYISLHLGISYSSVRKTVELLEDGATIPFLARYRKEQTGSLDEVQIGDIQKQYKRLVELESRKETVLAAIEEQGKLTPELRQKILSTFDTNELEDLYLPYKRKRKTKADIAMERGLEPLAKIIMSQRGQNIRQIASKYISDLIASENDAISGAQDIIAQWISEDLTVRERLRDSIKKHGILSSKVVAKKKDDAEKYKDYFEFQEKLSKCPSHRFLAIMRGESEGLLKWSIQVDDHRALEMIERKYIKSGGAEAVIIQDAIADSYKRLIMPSIETQIIHEFKEKADDEAIRVFGENLRQLLLAPPLGQKPVLAID
ncbi:MAG: Tex-like N-terminal domain-containing protein, partial [Saprospiraceae bacterium]